MRAFTKRARQAGDVPGPVEAVAAEHDLSGDELHPGAVEFMAA